MKQKTAVVIPCYKVKDHIANVISGIPEHIEKIYCIDDACPENSGQFITDNLKDKRVHVITHDVNQGVGGAVVSGYRQAIADGYDIAVKVDGDGQMDPALIPVFVKPLEEGACDYAKGNRFFYIEDVRAMPFIRLFGNAGLSFLTKLSSGYWHVFDPTNGYTAVNLNVLKQIPLDKIAKRYFFESDMLFRLNLMQAVVQDIPMKAVYQGETSNLAISKIFLPFLWGHFRNFCKRVFYNYFLRDFSVASIELLLSIPLLLFGIIFGASQWRISIEAGVEASAGTVMLSALPIIIGTQFLLSFLNHDISTVPRTPLHKKLAEREK